MEDEAGAELNTVLAGGIDLGANVVGFDAEGDEPFPWIVDAATKLNGEAVDARGLSRVNVNPSGERVGPRLPYSAVPGDARTRAIEHHMRVFISERKSQRRRRRYPRRPTSCCGNK